VQPVAKERRILRRAFETEVEAEPQGESFGSDPNIDPLTPRIPGITWGELLSKENSVDSIFEAGDKKLVNEVCVSMIVQAD